MDGAARTRHSFLLCTSNGGSVMHTALNGYGAIYDSDTLTTLGIVFDNAWASIAHNFDCGSRESARLRLASIILEFAADYTRDPIELKCRAIGSMQVIRVAGHSIET